MSIAAVFVAGFFAAAAPIELHPDVHLLRGAYVPGAQPDGNTVVLRGTDGLIVVDTGRHVAHAQRILEFARSADAPIAAIVNTHWHLDHVGGNPRIATAHPGVAVHASGAIRGAQSGFLARYRADLEAQLAQSPTDAPQRAAWQAEIAIIDAGPALHPHVEVTAAGPRTIAGLGIELGLENAATLGDVWLYDARSRVLVAGDLVTLPAPFLDTACPTAWRAALARLDGVAFETLVPGHGPALDRAGFARYRVAFGNLLDCAASDAQADVCIASWLADAGDLVPETDRSAARGLLEYYLDQKLRAAPDPALCAAP